MRFWFLMCLAAFVALMAQTGNPRAQKLWHKAVGTWQSKEDAGFRRTFTKEGKCIDTYSGEKEMVGAYRFTDSTDRKTVYLTIETEFEPLQFSVQKVTDTEMELTYLPRGSSQKFVRVQ